MKFSDMLPKIIAMLQAIQPVVDEIQALLDAGTITPVQAHAQLMAGIGDHLGKLGDGHLIQLVIQWAPQIIALINALTGGKIPPLPIPTPFPTPTPAPAGH